MKYTLEQLTRMIDHTILRAEATTDEIKRLCDEAKKYHFASTCVNPVKASVTGKALAGTDIKSCSVVGFPLGQNSIAIKVAETKDALANGANEIDYVINVGEAKEGNWDYLEREMAEIVAVCNEAGALSKVIFENCYLTKEEIAKLCEIASRIKPSFVKTSTGTTSSGATAEDVAMMAELTPDEVEVKASGGVRDANKFVEMLKAGATRIGASAGITIIEELKAKYFSNGEEYLEI